MYSINLCLKNISIIGFIELFIIIFIHNSVSHINGIGDINLLRIALKLNEFNKFMSTKNIFIILILIILSE